MMRTSSEIWKLASIAIMALIYAGCVGAEIEENGTGRVNAETANQQTSDPNNQGNGDGSCEDGETDGERVCVDGQWSSGASDCSEVDCGPGGTCVESDGAALCECDEGYDLEGDLCVEANVCTEGRCKIYILNDGDNGYQVVDFADVGLTSSIDGPVVAAFNLEDTDRAYLLTAASYFRINTNDFSIVASGALSEVHPELADGPPVVAAYNIPERHGDPDLDVGGGNDAITFVVNPEDSDYGQAYILKYDFEQRSFEPHPGIDDWVDIDWSEESERGKSPSVDEHYLAMWLDDENRRNFLQGSVEEVCGAGPTDSSGLVYQAILTPTNVHFAAATNCFPFLSRLENQTAPIFASFPNRPDPTTITAAFWHKRSLHLFSFE